MPHGYKLSEPSQGYYEILKEAYETLGFDLAILEKARADSIV
jgi:predicted ATPase